MAARFRLSWLSFIVVFSTDITSAEDLPSSTLVRARVKSVADKPDRGGVPAVLEIVHVYSGDSDLKGHTFGDVQRDQSTSGAEARSPFKVDEEGLWTIVSGEKNDWWPDADPRLPFRYRSRKVDNARFAQHVKLAEAIEKIETAKKSERAKLLVELVADKTPEIGVWAVCTLGSSVDSVAEKYLNGFAAKPDLKLSLQAQIALDEVLCKVKREEWFWTKPRTAMLKAWVAWKADEDDAYRILSRLDLAEQREELRNDAACEMVILATGNKDWPVKVRKYALTLLGKLGERVVDDSAAFDGLFDAIKNGQEGELRQAAAFSILKYIRLHEKRRKVIEEYLITEKDKTVVQALRDAIRKGIEKDHE